MGRILCIETSGRTCSVALAENGKAALTKEIREPNAHSTHLTVLIQELLKTYGQPVDAVAVSKGPGSYTGLRIGVSAAKGLCYGWDVPLIGISSLWIMAAHPALEAWRQQGKYICPMIDARRMEVYTACYNGQLEEIHPPRPFIFENDLRFPADKKDCIYAGDGVEKAREIITGWENAIIADGVEALAKNMSAEAEKKFQSGQFESLAYMEPFYLKDFHTTAKNS